MATLSVGGQLVATNNTLSNAVQDNITRLGTITSGTFPAGHVVQVQTSDWASKRAVGGWVTSNSYAWGTYALGFTMSNCTAGNKIILFGIDTGYQGEHDKGTYWSWFINDGANTQVALSNLAVGSGGMGGDTDITSSFYINSSAQDWGSTGGTIGYYTVQSSSGNSIECRLCVRVSNSSENIWNSQYSIGYGMEVQV